MSTYRKAAMPEKGGAMIRSHSGDCIRSHTLRPGKNMSDRKGAHIAHARFSLIRTSTVKPELLEESERQGECVHIQAAYKVTHIQCLSFANTISFSCESLM